MPPRIRRATEQDAPRIATIIASAFEPYRALYTPDAYAATVIDADTIAARLGEGPTWVALDHDIVATAAAKPTEHGLYIRSMASLVRGCGPHLLAAIERHARDHAIDTLYLSSTPFLDRAIALYERWGFLRGGPGPTDLHATPLIPMVKAVRDVE